MALTKADLIDVIVDQYKLDFSDAKQIVELFFEQIKKQLEQGNEVKLSGFGNFTLHDKAARPGRNPKTGDPALIKARRSVAFQPSLKFKKRVLEHFEK